MSSDSFVVAGVIYGFIIIFFSCKNFSLLLSFYLREIERWPDVGCVISFFARLNCSALTTARIVNHLPAAIRTTLRPWSLKKVIFVGYEENIFLFLLPQELESDTILAWQYSYRSPQVKISPVVERATLWV